MDNSTMTPLPLPREPNIIIRIFRGIINFIKSYLIVAGLFATITPIVIVYLLLHMEASPETSKSNKPFAADSQLILHLKLKGELAEKRVRGGDLIMQQLFEENRSIQLTDLERALRRASVDGRVKSVYLDVGSLQANYANLTSLHHAIAEFSKTEKPIHAHIHAPSTWLFYLASAAKTISVSETDGFFMPGPVFQLTYFKDFLAKLGIEFQVVRAGKFKSAMEPLIANEPSESTLEMYRALEESMLAHLSNEIATSRQLTPSQVRQWYRTGIFSAASALSNGIIDRIAYPSDQFVAQTKEVFPDAEIVTLSSYLNGSEDLDSSRLASGSDEIGFIEAFGTIVMDDPGGTGSESVITPEGLIEQIKYMQQREKVKAVVMRVVSPGGSALASDIIWQEIKKLASTKPLIVSMGSVAASGGYYIAAPAKAIFAEPTTITGSIGVIAAIPFGPQVSEKWGFNFHLINSSDREALLHPSKPPSDADQVILGQQIDEFYQVFIKKVAEGRATTAEAIHAVGQGRVYTGVEAKSLGLVDHLGGLEDAFKEAKRQAGLDENLLYKLATYHGKPRNALDCVGLSFEDSIKCFEQLETWIPQIHASIPSLPGKKTIDRVQLWHEILDQNPVAYLYLKPWEEDKL